MPQKRRSPGRATGATPKHRANGYADSSLHRPEDGYAAPTREEHREKELFDELRGLGYTVAVPCLACGHALTNSRSVRLHLGPTCRARAATNG